jgi:hypothetical protein
MLFKSDSMNSLSEQKSYYREKLFKEALNTKLTDNEYLKKEDQWLDLDKDVVAGIKYVTNTYLDGQDMTNFAINLYINEKMDEAFPQDFDSINNRDIGTKRNKMVVEFLNDEKAIKEYKNYKENKDNLTTDLQNQISSLSESSFFKTNIAFDKENSYSGEKFQLMEGYSTSLENVIIQETDKLNELYKDDPLYKDMKDPFLGDMYGGYSELSGYIKKVSVDINPNVIENNMLDNTIVNVNTYGLEDNYNANLLESTQKLGANYIKKEWLDSDLYKDFEAVDMSDKYKYGSMDKNTQFANAMKYAEFLGIDEEGQKTEQFKKEAMIFNEIFYIGLDMIDEQNLTNSFNHLTDETAIEMSKEFFGDEFDNIVQSYGEKDVSVATDRDKNLSSKVLRNTILATEYMSDKDDFYDSLQNTQEYITETKYLDKNKELLEYLEENLHSGTAEENYKRLTEYNLALQENERNREELLKYFDIFVNELEDNGVIGEYEDYNQKDSLPKSVSPILGKSIYA